MADPAARPPLVGPIQRWWEDDADESYRAQATPFFAKGSELESQGRFEEAFAAYDRGNRIMHAALNAETWIAIHAQGVRHLKQIFTADFIKAHASTNPEVAPIFIVGMPRSGSSLVEQILATHPLVQGMGETGALSAVVSQAYPFDLGGPLEPFRMAATYLDNMRAEGWRRAPRFTDKLLASYTAIGHIHLMFPRAIILHTVREPADSCLSCYRHLFDNDGHLRFAYDLRCIGRYYVAYREMMDHWRSVLMGRVIEVRNEALVADPGAGVRRLLAVCGLPWDARCLDFHRNPRDVKTASRFQVREPINAQSIGRWRSYRQHLSPLFEALGPYAPADA
jgi:hypothetical protein